MIERRPTALDDGINLETIQSNGYNRKESAALKEYGARTESSALKRPSEPQSMRGFSSGEVPKAANDPGWLFRKDCLDRKLKRQHITGIAFAGTIGIGLFVSSGQFIGIAGAPGSMLSFFFAGFIIIGVMRSLAELVSCRPVSGALIDYPHTFVDPALGFAVGVTYCLAQCISMATLTSAAARAAHDFGLERLSYKDQSGIIIGLCLITLFSNICGVRIYGQIERVVKWFKLLLILGLCLLMIIVRAGVRRRTDMELPSYQHDFSFAPFLGFNGLNSTASLADGGQQTGIGGEWGQFLAIWTCTTYAAFACMGGDLVIVTAGEAERPREDLPQAARFMYMAPIALYVIASLLVGLNVNYLDPGLYHPWALFNQDVPHSPFIVALQYTSIEVLPSFLNACFLISAYTAANTGLFVSSRTMFSLARTYGNDFLRNTVGRTNNGNTPILATLICSSFGLLAFLGLEDPSFPNFNQPILTLSGFFTSTICCVYASECIAFLRFKHGLVRLEENGVLSRDSDEYAARGFYRAHWQPLWAWCGLVGCIAIMLSSGWPAIYLLRNRHNLVIDDQLKSNALLAADIAGAYSGPLLFFCLYMGYKLKYRTSLQHFRDFETAYFVPEFDVDINNARSRGRPSFGQILKETWSLTY